jgi:HK97 family phage major capsid protein
MKTTIGKLQKRQGEINARLTALNEATLEGENVRSFTDVEKKEYDELRAEFDANKSKLNRLEDQKSRASVFIGKQQLNNRGEKGEKEELKRSFSLTRAFDAAANNRVLDGLEKEMHDEAKRESSLMGLSMTGNVSIPAFFMEKRAQTDREIEQRALAVTTNSGADFGNTVPTEIGGLIGILRPDLVMERLGAQTLTGLTGDINFPRQTVKSTGAWKDENADSDVAAPKSELLPFKPHRLPIQVEYSKQLLIQSSMDIENFVRMDIASGIRENVEYAALQGSGTNPVPFGVLNTSGIGSVAIGTNGGAPTFGKIVDLETELTSNNSTTSRLAYLSTPTMKGKLKQIEKAANTAQFVAVGNEMNGYPFLTTTQVPSALTKGSSSDCHAILFADWAQMFIGQWGGLDFTIDPYSKAGEALVIITVNSYWDIMLRQNKAFAAIQDARNV